MKCAEIGICKQTMRSFMSTECRLSSSQGLTAVVCVLLCVCVMVSSVGPTLLREKRDDTEDTIVYTRKGQSIVLPCNETLPTPPPDQAAFLPYITQWKRNDIGSIYVAFGGAPPFVHPDYTGRVSLIDSDLKSMQLTDVRIADEGWYECQIVVLDGDLRDTENGTFIQLIVIGPPRITQTSEPLVTYKEGEEARLECIAKGTPTPKLSWYKDGDAVIPGGRTSVTSEAVLFNGVKREDAGTYICRAESEEGSIESTIRLLLQGPPHIFIPPHDTTVTRDENVIFKCEAEASPSNITQQWYFNDIPVETTRELEGRWEHVTNGGLMIHDVVPGDEGWYTCSPTNGVGQPPQATAFLTVQYPAYVVSMQMRIFVTRGLDTKLTCDVDAKPPVDYIVWFKDGDQIAIRRLPRYNQEGDGSLVITSAELIDSGEYTCEPHNSLGTAGQSTSTALIVRDPPVFVTKPSALYQQAKGKDVTIPCSASGDPTPQIEWKKVNSAIPQYRSTITRTSLTIRDLTKSDHGIYECRATNEIATIVTSTVLYVEYTSPHPPYNVTIVTHITSVHVSWQPAYDGGYPQTYTVRYRPAVMEDKGWTSMGGITGDVTSLLLYDLESSTSYEFAVIATNQLGDSLSSAPIYATTRDQYDIIKPTDETGRTVFPPYLGLIPSPPRNVTLSVSQQGLVLTWQAPVHFAELVEKYAVEYRIDGPWLVLNDRIDSKKRRLLLDSLQPNTTYQFRVFAFTPAAFSDHSQVITEKIGDLSMFTPKPTGAQFDGPPGLIAGIIAGLCFLLLALVLSILAICLSHRRRKKKRLAIFSATSQTPQKLIHSPNSASKRHTNPVRSGLAKLKIKLSPGSSNKPQHPSARRGLYHVNNNSNHNSPNGKLPNHNLPNGGMDRSLSDRLLSGQAASYRVDIDVSNSTARMSREKRFASEEALGIEDLGMVNVQLHDRDYHRQGSYAYTYSNASGTTDDNQSETSNPPSTQDESESPLRPHDTDSGVGHGDYVYYHGRMFVAGSSTDDNDSRTAEEVDHVGIANGGLELNEIRNKNYSAHYSDVPLSRLCDAPPPQYTDAIRKYSDSPTDLKDRYVDLPKSDFSQTRKNGSPQKKTPPPKYPRTAKNPLYSTAPRDKNSPDNSHIPRQSTSKDLLQQTRSNRNKVRFSGQSTLSTIPGSPPDISLDSGMESGDTTIRTPNVKNKSPNRSKSPSRSPERVPPSQRNKPSIAPKPQVLPKPNGSAKSPRLHGSPTRSTKQKDYGIYENPKSAADPYQSVDKRHASPDRKSPYTSGSKSSPDRHIYNDYSPSGSKSSPERHMYNDYSPSRAVPSRPNTLTYESPPRDSSRSTYESPKRLYNNSPNSYRDPTYASMYQSPDSLGGTLRETSLLGGSPDGSPYNEKLSPVWQKQDATNTPGRKRKSPLYSTVGRKGTASTTTPSNRGSLPSSNSPQRNPLGIPQGRVPVEQVPRYSVDSHTPSSYTSMDESSSMSTTPDSADYQPYLPQASNQPHVSNLISPDSHHYENSSIVGGESPFNDTSLFYYVDTSSPIVKSPAYNSPRFDLIPESHHYQSESHDEGADSQNLELEVMSALQRYYEDPPAIQVPVDRTYDVQSEKVATMEARCSELKKEMQEFKRQQSLRSIGRQRSPGRTDRTMIRQDSPGRPERTLSRQDSQPSPGKPGRTLSCV